MKHRVAILALDHVVPMDMGTVTQVFGSTDGRYELQICTPTAEGVTAEFGMCHIVAPHDLSAIAQADTVVIPGIHGGPPITTGGLAEPVREALLEASGRARLISICTGAFVLAAAGLLDNRPATTHWRHAERFRRLYPRVHLNPEVLFVDDGDVLTSAGVTAGIDLCLHVVRKDHGTEVANYAARRCVAPAWRDGGQAQFIERPVPDPADTTTAPTRAWVQDRLHEPLDLSAMAEHARMSVRTFTRRFREEMGLSPGQWLLNQRVERARHLLEQTDLPVDRVATQSGFGTATAMRQRLHATVGVGPTAYRRTFRSAR
ncbi:AraC family transcriptional regulator [Rhizocola hellebori]|uniref:AraC family transcriptional regulator n=1 Tax=Rhizocola hellebori TaxID=1392758 RepID=A0A8J3QH30_9ACTN|nr:helix-turn-helix domain-containing protein [Rhizocola hellebori]GIH09186.1 AraC family transcriptional regulator [Rhizocola hellebori]